MPPLFCGQNIGCKPDILTAYRPLTVTLFRPALEPGLLCALACFPPAFLAVRRLQSDRQSGLAQHINHAALGEGFFQMAKIRMLLAERCQPLPQSGIVGLDVGFPDTHRAGQAQPPFSDWLKGRSKYQRKPFSKCFLFQRYSRLNTKRILAIHKHTVLVISCSACGIATDIRTGIVPHRITVAVIGMEKGNRPDVTRSKRRRRHYG